MLHVIARVEHPAGAEAEHHHQQDRRDKGPARSRVARAPPRPHQNEHQQQQDEHNHEEQLLGIIQALHPDGEVSPGVIGHFRQLFKHCIEQARIG